MKDGNIARSFAARFLPGLRYRDDEECRNHDVTSSFALQRELEQNQQW